MTSRCSGLLLSAPADARSTDDVIAFEGHAGSRTFGDLGSYITEPTEAKQKHVCQIFETGKLYRDRSDCALRANGESFKRATLAFSASQATIDTLRKTLRDELHVPSRYLNPLFTLKHHCGLSLRAALAYFAAQGLNASTVNKVLTQGSNVGSVVPHNPAVPPDASALCKFASIASTTVADVFSWVGSTAALRGTSREKKHVGCKDGITDDTKLFFDLGHTSLFGLGDALIRALGAGRISFLRIRRGRHQNAISFLRENKVPCNGEGALVLCPFDHGSVLLQDDANWPAKWTKLNGYQKCLFMVDEVEARWTALTRAHPGLETLEVSWNTSENLAASKSKLLFFRRQPAREHRWGSERPISVLSWRQPATFCFC